MRWSVFAVATTIILNHLFFGNIQNLVTKGTDAVDTDDTVANEGAFVTYTLANDKITAISTVADVQKVADLADTGVLTSTDITGLSASGVKESIRVRDVVDYDLFFNDKAVDSSDADVTELAEITVEKDGYVIYDLSGDKLAMFEGELEELEGLLVYGFKTDVSEDYDILVIFPEN